MESLIERTPEAAAWATEEKAKRSSGGVFDHVRSAVIWVDEPGPNHEAIGGSDPTALVTEINEVGQPLFRQHDPGNLLGRVVAAKTFVAPDGIRFVAAVLGFYGERTRLRFSDLGVDPALPASQPSMLPALPGEPWLVVATDPREVDSEWVDALLEDPPLRVKRQRLSHNAAESVSELIVVGLPYLLVVWNPFVTAIAQQAGKDAYAATHGWMRKLWAKLQERRNPKVEFQSFRDGCAVSFMFRGKNVKELYAAHDSLSAAAAQAASLIKGIKAKDERPTSLLYEFDPDAARWFPSHVVLEDGRLVKDRALLIAVEQLPTGISLGLLIGDED